MAAATATSISLPNAAVLFAFAELLSFLCKSDRDSDDLFNAQIR